MRKNNPKLDATDTSIVIPASASGFDSDTGAATGATGAAVNNNDPMLSSSAANIVPGMAGMSTGMIGDDFSTDYGQASYDVFDPLNWMLDGIVDFPYSFTNVQGGELSGIEGLGGEI